MKSAHLKLLGCKCNSPTINLTSTDTSVVARFPHLFGQFHFEGVHQTKPYFTNPSLNPAFLPSQAGTFNQLKPDTSSPRIKRAAGKIPCSSQDLKHQTQLDDEIHQVKKLVASLGIFIRHIKKNYLVPYPMSFFYYPPSSGISSCLRMDDMVMCFHTWHSPAM